MFSAKDLRVLIIPLIVEQALSMAIGAADTVMVASCSEAAVSAVSLIDSINSVFLWMFPAFASGGGIVLAQYMGRQDTEHARRSVGQLMLMMVGFSSLIAVSFLLFRTEILHLLFGKIEADVMAYANTYFLISIFSYPFIGIFNAGVTAFRSIGNSRLSMVSSGIANIINVCGNAILIYGFGMEVKGAAIASLVSRIAAALIVLTRLMHRDCPIGLHRWEDIRPRKSMFLRVVRVGIPSGIESATFNVGKLMVSTLVATLPTAQITANAVGNTLQGLILVPALAIHLAAVPIVGQCIGAGEKEQAKYYSRLLVGICYCCLFVTCGLVLLARMPLLSLFNLTPETTATTLQLLYFYCAAATTLYPIAFTFTPSLRAAGDVRFCLWGAMTGMWVGRVAGSHLMVSLGFGLLGIWMAMGMDWIIRILFYVPRYLSGKWLEKKVI